VGYVADERGRLTGVRVVRTRLGAPDSTGRRSPSALPAGEAVLPVNLAAEALGEALDEALAAVLPGVAIRNGVIAVNPETFATSRPGVFAAGDAVNGGTTVARALAEGRQAAEAIDEFLRAPRKA
jgi:glutamate synthase (NADPH/NADH) small chain